MLCGGRRAAHKLSDMLSCPFRLPRTASSVPVIGCWYPCGLDGDYVPLSKMKVSSFGVIDLLTMVLSAECWFWLLHDRPGTATGRTDAWAYCYEYTRNSGASVQA